jgi:hypothetical protein
MNIGCIRQDKNTVIANDDNVVLIISSDLIDNEIAEVHSEHIDTLGFFEIRHYSSPDKFKSWNATIPFNIKLNILRMEKESDGVHLYYNKNDIIINSTEFFRKADNVNKFLSLLTTSKIKVKNPTKLVSLFKENATKNDIKLAVPSVAIEAMISELIRWNKDTTRPLRIALKNKDVKITDFTLVSMKEVSRLTSVFNAISFEDINKSVQAGVSMTRNNQEQIISPVEKLIQM